MKNQGLNSAPLPEKLKEARIARGLSMPELAEKIGLTKQAISKYELGLSTPSHSVLGNMAEELAFPLAFFYDHAEKQQPTGITFFRSLKSAEKRSRDVLCLRAEWMGRIFTYLKNYVDFVDVDLGLDFEIKEHYEPSEIEKLATDLRRAWGLGLGPVSDVLRLLENHGVVIARMDTGVNKIDACSQWRSRRPFIFLSADKGSAARSRFDAAHELGHSLLHSWVEEEHLSDIKTLNRIEMEANLFAGAFLLPRDTFGREIMSTSLDHFINLKKRWKVSIAAMIYRCKTLGIFTDHQISYLWRQLTYKKYRTFEPLDDILIPEEPSVLKDAVELLLQNNIITPIDILDVLKLNSRDLELLCNLSEGTLAVDKPRANLRLVERLQG